MINARPRPSWLDEETLLLNILQRFVDQIEQNTKAQCRINAKATPELFDPLNNDPRYLWGLIKSLDKEYHLLTIKTQNVRGHQESFEGALLIFNQSKEQMLRAWLNRPALDPYALIWHDSLEKVRHVFEDNGEALSHCIRVPQKTASEVIKAFASLRGEINTPQTLRNLSSRCFWGNSKFLDKQRELINELFPEGSKNIIPRPILLDVVLPKMLGEVIFIENLETFLMLRHVAEKELRFIKTAFVYSAGFKGSASPIRLRDRAVFSAIGSVGTGNIDEFKQWWQTQDDSVSVPCYFWGDLDFSGLSILARLRSIFPSMTAWELGYREMLRYYETGLGHSSIENKKSRQEDPMCTGCQYADETLLPLIRKEQRFLDQEVIHEHSLLHALAQSTSS